VLDDTAGLGDREAAIGIDAGIARPEHNLERPRDQQREDHADSYEADGLPPNDERRRTNDESRRIRPAFVVRPSSKQLGEREQRTAAGDDSNRRHRQTQRAPPPRHHPADGADRQHQQQVQSCPKKAQLGQRQRQPAVQQRAADHALVVALQPIGRLRRACQRVADQIAWDI
jgi:hypothetical protein